jgi:hypothetical protein
MSQSTIAQPTVTAPTHRRVSALALAVVALVATLAIAVAVFAWTVGGGSEPAPPTLPAAESDLAPSTDADVLPADGVPTLNESCLPRQKCAY